MNRPRRWRSSRRMRPPVMVSAPVSMIVTSHDSGGVLWRTTSPESVLTVKSARRSA